MIDFIARTKDEQLRPSAAADVNPSPVVFTNAGHQSSGQTTGRGFGSRLRHRPRVAGLGERVAVERHSRLAVANKDFLAAELD
jgi:hypothetical protein